MKPEPSPPPAAVSSPRAVRELILAEHERLRAHLTVVQGLLPPATCGDEGACRALTRAAEELVMMFERHLTLEDEVLAPALEAADAWGAVRRADLEREHERQRRDLAAIARKLREPVDADLVSLVAAFAAALVADMDEEERHSLDGDTLRDDLVTIAQIDG